MSAPERIWWNGAPLPHSYTSTVRFSGSTEYVRADLAAADAAAMAAVRAFIAGQTKHNCGLVRQLKEMLE